MRRNIIIFVFVAIGFVVIAVFCALFLKKTYRNFKITDVNLSEVIIENSLLNKDQDRKYYLLEFTISYCNGSMQFLGGSVEPGLEGIIDPIESIKILDLKGNNISSFFHKVPNETPDLWLNDFLVSSRYTSIDSLVESINLHKREETGFRITTPKLFVIDSEKIIPDSIIMVLGTHCIGNSVNISSNPLVLSEGFK